MIRKLEKNDIDEVIDLVKRCMPYVVPYNPYAYWILHSYYSNTCRVAEFEGKIIGFLSAMPSMEKKAVFIWQLCVDRELRGGGVGTRLLDSVVAATRQLGFSSIQFSIADTNRPSYSLFKRYAEKNGMKLTEMTKESFGELTEILYQIDIK